MDWDSVIGASSAVGSAGIAGCSWNIADRSVILELP